MPNAYRGAVDLAPLLDGSSPGELIPELAHHGLQQLIELEVAAVLGADRHERTMPQSQQSFCVVRGLESQREVRLMIQH
jgi:hypothetical protein